MHTCGRRKACATLRYRRRYCLIVLKYLVSLLLTTVIAVFASAVTAKTVYTCRGADGSATMQDQPCSAATTQSERDIAETYRSTSRISEKRSSKAKAEFQRSHPCPRNGATRGRCPGYDIEHIDPLCAGGPDVPGNMQWLTLEEHREKTRKDVFRCRTAAKARKAS